MIEVREVAIEHKVPDSGLTDLIENLDYDSIIRVNEEFEAIDELSLTGSSTHRLF